MTRLALLLSLIVLAPVVARGAGTHTVELSTVEDRKAIFGTVESVDVVAARARIGGTVSGLVVDEGTPVIAGQVIARIEDPKLTLQLVAIDARLRSLDSQRELAELELDRMTRLRASGAVSQSRLDEAQTNLDVIRSNQSALEAERAVVAEQMAEGAVEAPGNGRVLQVHVTENSVVMAGEPIATIAAEQYVLRIRLPERHARFIEEGDSVLVGGRGLAPRDVTDEGLDTGVIRQVYPEMSNGRVVADVIVADLGSFFVGERVRVYVQTGRRDAIVIPTDFLRRRYGVAYVMLEDEGEVMVQPGQHRDGSIEILSGLRPGDVLVKP